MTYEFEIDLDVPPPDLDAFAELAEDLGVLGEEGGELIGDGDRVYLSAYIDRPTLMEALLYALHYLQDKHIQIKSVAAPKSA
jgi:hypothetical protein